MTRWPVLCINVSEAYLKPLQAADKAPLPERVGVAGWSDDRSFKAIDNEGRLADLGFADGNRRGN
jgi:hypothetical protein